MKNKNKQILGLTLAAAVFIGILGSAYALFTSRDNTDVKVKAGNLDVETVVDPINGFTNKDSVLPGNNDPSLKEHGQKHEINFKVKNMGNTAIRTRQTIVVDLTNEKDEVINPQHVRLFEDESLKAELEGKSFLVDKDWVDALEITQEDLDKATAVSYRFVADSFDGLDNPSQVREGLVSQLEDEVSKKYSYSFGLMKEAGNEYQNANINVEIITEAVQYDNTDSGVFSDASSVDYTTTQSIADIKVVPHKTEKTQLQ